MKILVINSGSSSLKYELFDMENETSLLSGTVSRIGTGGAENSWTVGGVSKTVPVEASGHERALSILLDFLQNDDAVPVTGLSEIGAVAHRVGHGGPAYRSAAVIDNDLKNEIKRLIPVMPLHHPAMLAGIEACEKLMPSVPHVAVFDTAFHSTIPDEASIYGIPHEMFRKGIRRFGFHGNSHDYVAGKASEFLEVPLKKLNIITCHLGNGASVCAVQRGKSVDTSMGFSPLEGLIMGTRVGNIDPGIIPYLINSEGMTIDQVDEMFNKKGGLLGISGVSPDMREILTAADQGNGRALLAIKAFCYRIKTYIGAYTAVMGHVDVIVFTGGIGENSRGIRARSLQGLERLGIAVDPVKNDRCGVGGTCKVFDITARQSGVDVLVIATDEELMMARQCARALNHHRSINRDVMSVDKRPIRVSVSAHHVHLSRPDVDALFGRGYNLAVKSPLYIDSEFACEETVNLIGPRGRVDKVRILGPERAKTQVEISRTEEFKLGIDAPIRASGDLEGSPGIKIEGPGGTIEIPEGVICAMRHIHMTPEDAENYGVKDKDIVMVKILGERELIFGDVLVRVKPAYKLEMHIDTDEANAAELPPVSEGYLVRIESREAQ